METDNASPKNAGVSESRETSGADLPDSPAAPRRRKNKKLNLRRKISCAVLCFTFVAAFVASALVFRGCSALNQTADDAYNAAKSALSDAAQSIQKSLAAAPKATVSYETEFLGASPENKYVVAGIDERVKIRADFSKFKFLSGSLQMEAVAHYQYYIPFRGLKFDTSKSDDGMLRFAFYFDALECETPVKYSEIKCDVRESSISDGVNAKIAEYKKKRVPAVPRRAFQKRAKHAPRENRRRSFAEKIRPRKRARAGWLPRGQNRRNRHYFRHAKIRSFQVGRPQRRGTLNARAREADSARAASRFRVFKISRMPRRRRAFRVWKPSLCAAQIGRGKKNRGNPQIGAKFNLQSNENAPSSTT
ncbi:hypothetical protein P3B99_007565 [Opitutia bacterium KCR 482]|nr:hypothetical protein [Opitutae bacterium KCR 482]MDF3287111.1 hypothetical protein [Opitutae bacterium KCR 482]